MSEFTSYAPGCFCWVDTASPDPDASTSFYTRLFGWEAVDVGGDMGPYWMFMKNGKPVAGMGRLMPEQLEAGVPPHWLNYVNVGDVDETVERAVEAGGSVIAPRMEIPGSGTMAVLADRQGATFAVWQPGGHVGSAYGNEHGAFSWEELMTRDLDGAAEFYSAVFGWSTAIQEMPSGPYLLFMDGEQLRAGAMLITEEMGDFPPFWGLYFGVDDADAAATAIEELGGQVLTEVMDIEGVGRMAPAVDSVGAHFSFMQPAEPT
jgi:predicted enzyme related to lactoylglutathione lyase